MAAAVSTVPLSAVIILWWGLCHRTAHQAHSSSTPEAVVSTLGPLGSPTTVSHLGAAPIQLTSSQECSNGGRTPTQQPSTFSTT
eukprot:6209442-Amphidinium_carterae.1